MRLSIIERSGPHDLQIVRAATSDFTERQMNEVLPIRGAEYQSQLAVIVEQFVGPEVSPAHHPEHAVELIHGKHGRGRIVDRRRQGPERDIDDDSKRKRRVLLHGSLGAERHGRSQHPLVN